MRRTVHFGGEGMIYREIGLGKASLRTYVLSNYKDLDPNRRRAFILICPGGGYQYCSEREAEPVAIKFNSLGYNAAVLYYTVNPAGDIHRDEGTEVLAVHLHREHAPFRAFKGKLQGRDHAPVRATQVHYVAVDARVGLDRGQERQSPPFGGGRGGGGVGGERRNRGEAEYEE